MTDKTTHAQRRRLEAQVGSRLKLRAGQFVRRLREIADKAETAEPSHVPALRLKADIYTRLLAKCLPDLKAIEHSGGLTVASYDSAIAGVMDGASSTDHREPTETIQ